MLTLMLIRRVCSALCSDADDQRGPGGAEQRPSRGADQQRTAASARLPGTQGDLWATTGQALPLHAGRLGRCEYKRPLLLCVLLCDPLATCRWPRSDRVLACAQDWSSFAESKSGVHLIQRRLDTELQDVRGRRIPVEVSVSSFLFQRVRYCT